MERVMQDLVHGNVIEGVLKGPVRNRIAVTEATCLPGRLVDVQPSSLVSLPSGPACDDDLCSHVFEPSLEWLDLANSVVLLDVRLVLPVMMTSAPMSLSPLWNGSTLQTLSYSSMF